MVDCGSRRCAQERRSLRRDLQSLSKKLPVILGLESIADVFAKEQDQGHALEQTHQRCRDFQSSSRCFYCEKKLPNVYKRIHRIINDAQTGKENKGKLCLRSLQDLIPFCLDFYKHGFGRELFSDCVKNYFTSAPTSAQEEEPKTSCAVQSASSITGNLIHTLNVPATAIDNAKPSKHFVPIQSQSVKPSSSRIIGEKRGSRKRDAMSMMHHPVPEAIMNATTLKQEPDNFLLDSENITSVAPGAADFYNMFLSQLPSMDLRENNHPSLDYKDLQFPFALQNFLMNSQMVHPAYLSHDSNLLKEIHLAQVRRMHNLDGVNKSHPRPAHGSQLKLPILIDIVRKLVREKFTEIKKHHRSHFKVVPDDDMDDAESMSNTPRPDSRHLSSSLFSMAYPENELNSLRNGSNFLNSMSEDSLKLKRFGKVNECSRIGSTLKDIIVKSIAEKVKLRDDSSDENSCPSSPNVINNRQLAKSGLSHNYFSSLHSLSLKSFKSDIASTSQYDIDYNSSPPKRFKKDRVKSNKSGVSSPKKSPDTVSSPPGLKKTRPKRGQYRKYNSQLLMDAVRAVQSGEMSVHRAGSFFGVPHSTLEYKVKERHLLRQRKVKDSRSSPISSSSPKSDHQQSSLRLTIDLSRELSPTLSEAGSCTTPSSTKKSEFLPSSSVINLDKNKASPALLLDQKIPELLLSSSSTSALPTSPSASIKLINKNNSGKKDVASSLSPSSSSSSTANWLQPYLCGSSSTTSDVPPETFQHSLSSLSLDNSASELLRKLQHKVQTSSKSFSSSTKSCSIPPMPSLPSKDSAFDTLDSSSALSGRFPVFNQSA